MTLASHYRTALDLCIIVVQCAASDALRTTMASTSNVKPAIDKDTVRTSVSLPREHYNILASVAEQNRVSVAWVVRDAVARYVEDRWPLLGG